MSKYKIKSFLGKRSKSYKTFTKIKRNQIIKHDNSNKVNKYLINESIITQSIVMIFKDQVNHLISSKTLEFEIKTMISRFNLWVKTKGPLETIRRIKTIRMITVRFLCNKPLLTLENSLISIDKDGLPNLFSKLVKSYLLPRDNPVFYRLILTVLQANKFIKA